jgi:hypothetical protein
VFNLYSVLRQWVAAGGSGNSSSSLPARWPCCEQIVIGKTALMHVQLQVLRCLLQNQLHYLC